MGYVERLYQYLDRFGISGKTRTVSLAASTAFHYIYGNCAIHI